MAQPKYPRLKSRYHVEVLDSEHVFLMTEHGHYVLKGSIFIKMLPLLDGMHTPQDIVHALSGQASPMQVMYALSHLVRSGYLAEGVPETDKGAAAYWESLDQDALTSQARLTQARVSLGAYGDVSTNGVATALGQLGIDVAEGADFCVVLVNDYLHPDLRRINRDALKRDTPWMLAKPVGTTVWIGPIFVPNQTGCWECLFNRLHGNREIEAFLQRQLDRTDPFPVSIAQLPTTVAMADQLIATEVAKWLVHPEGQQLAGQIVTLDTDTLELQRHKLVRRPQCLACGEPIYQNPEHPKPIKLQSCIKAFTTDGGHRITTPEAMLERFDHHISGITGVISSLSPVIEVENIVYIYGSMHNFALNYSRWEDLRRSLRWRSGGKGLTRNQSRASALGESLERYSGIIQGYEYTEKASYNELADRAIHPNKAMLISDKQYAERDQINHLEYRFHYVPVPMDPDEQTDWTPVWSLTEQGFKLIPTAYCYYNYWPATRFRDAFCWADSNGNASGSTLEEAILQALMELVERDCVGVWWYNRLQRPMIDLESFGDPRFLAVRDHYASINRDIWLLDISSDLNIPVIAAISRQTDGPGDQILLGYGAHFDPKIAASRALTEMSELLGALSIEYEGEDPLEFDDPNMTNWMRTATIDEQFYLKPNPDLPVRRYQDFPKRWTADLRDDVQMCVDILREADLETFVLDQTRPDIGLNVVKCIVPGLCHFWARFAPGRLYDVPVNLGWLETATLEEDLNPIPMFF
ncbi:MAG: TOMM precursor leader peptide-binding protein [Chloroflexi bacterium]|nr:TOMM precursor leader peptide-binding protein [Chloroflexota bacterium]